MRLQTVLALVVVLTGTAYGMEFTCDATLSVSCYGTHGQPLFLLLVTDKTRQFDLRLYRTKDNSKSLIFGLKRNKTIYHNQQQRWKFSPDNGFLIINPVKFTDSGTYSVEIYHTTGTLKATNYVHLIINKTTPTTLTVSNMTYPPQHNDTVSKEQAITLISGSLGVLFLCVAGTGGVYYICKRRKSTHRTAEPEEPEVEYADVSILKRQKKQLHQKKRREEAVEYGELNVQRAEPEETEVEYADVSILK
ncbi:uncharacterized protein LOC121694465 [Alosa sapidissima]|uniref:uncharacterized protein LOC121694465 n=1 Tax=Alosa sapidissima TaxID=34773 RepID=UPI001C085516|nr:uncharacterized protein LOC121694465 [Alosa sapidissima]